MAGYEASEELLGRLTLRRRRIVRLKTVMTIAILTMISSMTFQDNAIMVFVWCFVQSFNNQTHSFEQVRPIQNDKRIRPDLEGRQLKPDKQA